MAKEQWYSVNSARLKAKRILPRAIFDFIDGAAEDEVTAGRNEAAFQEQFLLPRMLAGHSTRDKHVELFGASLSAPVLIGPTGSSGLAWPRGEVAAAKAAHAFGTVYIVSHASTVTLEEIAHQTNGPLWFQSFLFRDRQITERLARRAARAGYQALVLTVDTQVPGQRERDIRNRFSVPLSLRPRNFWDFGSHPRWFIRMASAGSVKAANYTDEGFGSLLKAGQRIPTLLDPTVGWDDVKWLRDLWKGPLVMKGILHPEEAAKAAEIGIDAVIVSNHGGRQFDGVAASFDALPAIVRAINRRIPVLLDGGIRRGADVIRAMSSGATAVLIGRPHLWGLAVAGEPGVLEILKILDRELDRGMALCGIGSLENLSDAMLFHPSPQR
ncbi:MAG: alpha-hydroxy acid oxidase [Pusillimonas sp.]